MASNTLSEFISHIKSNNIARVNRFRITFTMPDALIASMTAPASPKNSTPLGSPSPQAPKNLSATKVISLTCLTADIPGRQLSTAPIEYGNFTRKIPYSRSTNEFSTSFLVTGKMDEKKIFDSWSNIIFDETKCSTFFYDDFISSILVESLDTDDVVVYSFELTEVYPSFISSIRLDRTAQNQQMFLDVTWAYHKVIADTDSFNSNKDNTDSSTSVPGKDGISLWQGPGKSTLISDPVAIHGISDDVSDLADSDPTFSSQLSGIFNKVAEVKDRVSRDIMSKMDGVRQLNGVIKDVNAMNIPTKPKSDITSTVRNIKNTIGNLNKDTTTIAKYPKFQEGF